MSKQVILESERLLYKPLDSSYCTETYHNWMNDEEVIRYMEIFDPYSKKDLQHYLEKASDDSELLFWAIHIKENGKHIGNIKIDPVNRRHKRGEYGIMVGDKTEWGKGYAREASETIIQYCFEKEDLQKITLGVIEGNNAALHLYKKIGFEIEGVYRKHGIYNQQFHDTTRMAIFNPSFSSDP